jgi:hypothetical protein
MDRLPEADLRGFSQIPEFIDGIRQPAGLILD